MFLKKISFNAKSNTYPFIKPINNIKELEFNFPITIIVGDNASGKTTLIKLIAKKLGCYSINADDNNFNVDISQIKIQKQNTPTNKFIFTSEDFINYINKLEEMKKFAKENIEEINNNKTMGSYAKIMARTPHASTLYQINNMYKKNLSNSSHGEGYLEFFISRLKPNGFYVLDEPEAALSYENQYKLAYKINQLAKEENCQFVIATHSPIIAKIPNATIYEIKNDSINKTSYDDIENISFLKLFIKRDGNGFFK